MQDNTEFLIAVVPVVTVILEDQRADMVVGPVEVEGVPVALDHLEVVVTRVVLVDQELSVSSVVSPMVAEVEVDHTVVVEPAMDSILDPAQMVGAMVELIMEQDSQQLGQVAAVEQAVGSLVDVEDLAVPVPAVELVETV